MKIQSEREYILPVGWKVLYNIQQSPLHRDFVIIAKHKDKIGIFRFDDIEEYPTMIETYYINHLRTNSNK